MPKKKKNQKKKRAPRNRAGDQLPVDAPPTDQTRRPAHPPDQLPVDPLEAQFLDTDLLNTEPLDNESLDDDADEEMERYPTVDELHKRINANIQALLQRFENIMAIAAAKNTSHVDTAVEGFQLDNEVTSLIRAAEDLLALSRTMKEMWMAGRLRTIGEDKRERERREKMEADVQAIWKMIEEGNLKRFITGTSDEPSEKADKKPSEEPAQKASEEPTQEPSEEPTQEPSAEK